MAETGGSSGRGRTAAVPRCPARLGVRGGMLLSASPAPKVPKTQGLCRPRGRVPTARHPLLRRRARNQRRNEMFMRKCIIQHFISSTLHVSREQEHLRAFIAIAVMQRRFNQSCASPQASPAGGGGLSPCLLVGSTAASLHCPSCAPGAVGSWWPSVAGGLAQEWECAPGSVCSPEH